MCKVCSDKAQPGCHDGIPLENLDASPSADIRQAMEQQVLPQERHPQVGSESEHMHLDAREQLPKPSTLCGKSQPCIRQSDGLSKEQHFRLVGTWSHAFFMLGNPSMKPCVAKASHKLHECKIQSSIEQ